MKINRIYKVSKKLFLAFLGITRNAPTMLQIPSSNKGSHKKIFSLAVGIISTQYIFFLLNGKWITSIPLLQTALQFIFKVFVLKFFVELITIVSLELEQVALIKFIDNASSPSLQILRKLFSSWRTWKSFIKEVFFSIY